MRVTTDKEIEGVLRLDAPARHRHFVKRAADEQRVWGLWKEGGWALMGDDEGRELFPLWPAAEYAAKCAVADWATYQPAEILLDELLDELFPKLESRATSVAVFPTPGGKGVSQSASDLALGIRHELKEWYGEE